MGNSLLGTQESYRSLKEKGAKFKFGKEKEEMVIKELKGRGTLNNNNIKCVPLLRQCFSKCELRV